MKGGLGSSGTRKPWQIRSRKLKNQHRWVLGPESRTGYRLGRTDIRFSATGYKIDDCPSLLVYMNLGIYIYGCPFVRLQFQTSL